METWERWGVWGGLEGEGLAWLYSSSLCRAGLLWSGGGEPTVLERGFLSTGIGGSTEPRLSQNRQRGSLGGMQSGPHPGISGQSAGRRQWD